MSTVIKSPFNATALVGNVALITGGASGIGLEISRQLGLHGAKLVLTGRRQKVLDVAVAALKAEGIEVSAVQGDVRNPEDCIKAANFAVSTYGKLSILINCAAGNFLATAETLSPKGFKTVMDIDTNGTFNMSSAAFPHLKAAKGASIINISATLHYGATWYQTHASAAKAAVDSLTRSLALEWGDFGIRVNGVAPGPIAGTAGLTKLGAGIDESKMKARIPAGRMGSKTDIALACVYLASEAGSFVSGHTVVVDGAAWMYHTPLAPRAAIAAFAKKIEATSRATGVANEKGKALPSKL